MTHDPNFYRDEDGNSLVSREPFPCEYVATSKTGDIERGIAQAAGFRVVELNDEGRVVEPLASYLKDEPDAFSPKWTPLAQKIRSEFHPAPPSEAKEAGTAPANASKPVNPAYGEVRFISPVAPGTVTETFEDGMTCTSSVGRRGRIETPPVQVNARTFNPFTVDMNTYMELRRQGFSPEVRMKGAEHYSPSRSVNLDAWSEYRSESAKPHEMETWLEARARGEVPA